MKAAVPFPRLILILFVSLLAGIANPAAVYSSSTNNSTLASANASYIPVVCDKSQSQNVLGVNEKSIAPKNKPLSLSADIIFSLINQHRSSMGLPAFEKDANLCSLAVERGPEAYKEAYENGQIHSGLYNRNLSYWVTENMKYGTNENGAMEWWLSSPIHRKAIESSARYSCGECYGDVCIQLFTSYVQK